jgi:hypothetical protein
MLGGEAGNYTTTDSCKEKVSTIELATIKQNTTRRYPELS